jgi:predicted enzyme involved in methoxymalonyl-ACP biosynthesis
MEDFTLNIMVERAKAAGYKRIVGEYLPTAKNGMVENHYPNLGFKPITGYPTAKYVLEVKNYTSRKNYIKEF